MDKENGKMDDCFSQRLVGGNIEIKSKHAGNVGEILASHDGVTKNELESEETLKGTSFAVNGLEVPPSDLQFNKPDLPEKYRKKREVIAAVLSKHPVDREALLKLAVSDGGLVDDDLRKDAWPVLLNLMDKKSNTWPTENEIEAHPEYNQVVLDVERSLKRFPPGIPLNQRLKLQMKLTRLILRVITKHRDLHYYQGYHDVAVTFLLVTGEDTAFQLLEHLSLNHFKDCMEPTIEKTSYLLNYIYPLVRHQNEKVYAHLEAADVGTVFALPWYITWFGHTLTHYSDVVRLYDYFLVMQPLAPIYLSSVIVAHRADRILAEPCDIGAVHQLLCNITDGLPFEELVEKTTDLMERYPVDKLEAEVRERVESEKNQREKELALRKLRALNNGRNVSIFRRLLGGAHVFRRIPFLGPHIPARYFIAFAVAAGALAVYMRSIEEK